MKLLLKRLVQLFVFLVLVLVLVLVALHWYQPKVPIMTFLPPKPVSGAAVFYNQAFAAMPELSEEEKKLLKTKPGEPLDTEAAKHLVPKFDASLRFITQGVPQPQCEWGLDFSFGSQMPIPHLVKGLVLSNALGLRVRLRLLNGDIAGATDDLLRMLRFARHLGEPTLFIGSLVRISSDATAIDLTVRSLQDFDLALLQRLSAGIATLPSSHSLQEAEAEDSKVFASYLRNLLAKEQAGQKLESSLPRQEGVGDQGVSTTDGIIEIMRKSPTLYLFMVNKYEQRSQELVKLMGLPYVEGRPKIDALEQEIKKNAMQDIFSALALPALCATRRNEVQMEAAWAIFRTALATQLRNPAEMRGELAKLRDPYDDGPMEWRDVPGGVEVKLKAPADKKTMTLMVGLSGK